MRKVYIVLIAVKYFNARRACEYMEATIIEDTETALHVRNYLCEKHEVPLDLMEVEPITDFMDRLNNQEFQEKDYFMSYVYGEETNG